MGTLRINIPDDADPLPHLMTQIGSPQLRSALVTMGSAMFLNDSGVTAREREAGRFYLASLVACQLCEENRPARDLAGYSDADIEDGFYENILEWRTWPGYTERERLVIEFYERFLVDHASLAEDDDVWARLAARFAPTEIEDLCILAMFAAAMNSLREVALGVAPLCGIASGAVEKRG